MAHLIGDLTVLNSPLAQFAGTVVLLVGAYLAVRRFGGIEQPKGQADVQLSGSTAAREEVAAATEMIRAQREFILNANEQVDAARRAVAEAQSEAARATTAARAASDEAHVAKVAAEEAKLDLAKAQSQAAQERHDLANSILDRDGRIAALERQNAAQADQLAALEAQLGIRERRTS